jgi:hypothetical protein
VKVIARQVDLSRSLGLMPGVREEASVREDARWLLEQFARVLRQHGVSSDAIQDLRALTSAEGER